jgi:MFS family permease
MTLRPLRSVAAASSNLAAEAGASAAARARLPLAVMVAIGAGLVTLGLTIGEPLPTAGLVALGLPVGAYALRRLTPPGTLRARPVLPAAVLLRGVLTFMYFGIDAFVPLALVEWRGISLPELSIALTATTLVWTAGSWVQARNSSRWPTYRFVQAGFAVSLIGLAGLLLALRQDISWTIAIPTFALAGFGMGLAYSPLALIVLREASADTQGSASSALSLTDTLGSALGTGLTGAIIAVGVRASGRPVPGLAIAFAICIAVGVAGLLATRRLRGEAAGDAPAGALPPAA